MDTVTFDKLLLKTAFCCMVADGNIDDREITLIKSMCEKSPLFANLNFYKEINLQVEKINSGAKPFIQNYLDLLSKAQLNEQEELVLIDFAIQTIIADEQIEYSEIKFFKNIRHRLSVSDEKILARFPDIEQYLEDDIITDTFLDKITSQYFEAFKLPHFEVITADNNLRDNDKRDE